VLHAKLGYRRDTCVFIAERDHATASNSQSRELGHGLQNDHVIAGKCLKAAYPSNL
jgi:hypothetical protein